MAQLMPVLVNSLHSSVAASNCLLGMVSVTLLFSDQPHELFRRVMELAWVKMEPGNNLCK